jgi:hypothetical protein
LKFVGNVRRCVAAVTGTTNRPARAHKAW